MSRLNGKVALVTGASKGIGASIAKELAANGAAVAVNYSSSPDGAKKVVAEIEAAGGKAIAVQANVADPDSIGGLIATVVKQLGPIDILVNNAGIYEFAPLGAITPEHFHKQFDLNVLGLLLTTQAAVAQFSPKGGSIINIGSVAAEGVGTAAVYSATKGAVDSVTYALAQELGPKKIRVNSLNPRLWGASASPAISQPLPRSSPQTMRDGSTVRQSRPLAATVCKNTGGPRRFMIAASFTFRCIHQAGD